MAEKIKVGVVSSHVDTVTNLCNYLENKGFKAVWAYNNEEVEDLCQKENPEIIVINVSLENQQGFEIAKKFKNLKFLFMSADDGLSEKADKIPNSIGFIKKPVDLIELEAKIKLFIKSKGPKGREGKKVLVIT